MSNKSAGQSIIEAVFLIGALALVLSGASVLLLNTVNSRTKGFDRKKASELAQVVLEEQLAVKTSDPATFWAATLGPAITNQSRAGFSGYTYDLSYATVSCAVSTQCARATVLVKWMSGGLSMSFNRLFSR